MVMQIKRNSIRIISGIIWMTLMLAMGACSQQVKLSDWVNLDQPIQVLSLIKDDRTMLGEKNITTLEPGSNKFVQFITWCENNQKGWKKTIASFEPRSVISQNNFKLNYMGYFVSVEYEDQKGESYHYSKTIDLESLSFLFE